ncbi:MAG: NAD-dependent epimerase/dehydratase family protein [Bacteroidota bacterium]
MKIAVTGASGHVGANLCRVLIAKGCEVNVLAFNDKRGFEGLKVNSIKGDLLDPKSLDNFVKGCDVVVHLAAQISISGDKGGQVYKTNVEGTRNIVNKALEHEVKKFVHFTSIHAFNQFPLEETLDESRPLVNGNALAYDRSKAEGERIVMEAVDKGLNAVILSPTSILGPHDYKPSFVGRVLIKMYKGELPALVSGGYDWVDVRDVVDGTVGAIEYGKKGEKYLLSGNWLSIPELSKVVGIVTGKNTPKWVCPTWLAKAGLPIMNMVDKMKGDESLYTRDSLNILVTGNRKICSEKARVQLGFMPRSIEVTLDDTYDWFKRNGHL